MSMKEFEERSLKEHVQSLDGRDLLNGYYWAVWDAVKAGTDYSPRSSTFSVEILQRLLLMDEQVNLSNEITTEIIAEEKYNTLDNGLTPD